MVFFQYRSYAEARYRTIGDGQNSKSRPAGFFLKLPEAEILPWVNPYHIQKEIIMKTSRCILPKFFSCFLCSSCFPPSYRLRPPIARRSLICLYDFDTRDLLPHWKPGDVYHHGQCHHNQYQQCGSLILTAESSVAGQRELERRSVEYMLISGKTSRSRTAPFVGSIGAYT